MAGKPLRVISFAYTTMSISDWKANYDNGHQNLERAIVENLTSKNLRLNFIGSFGLKDPLRKNVASCVDYARNKAKMTVRLVSGDHHETAK